MPQEAMEARGLVVASGATRTFLIGTLIYYVWMRLNSSFDTGLILRTEFVRSSTASVVARCLRWGAAWALGGYAQGGRNL